MKDRKVWFLKIYDQQGNCGEGEVAPIPHLSPEDVDEVPLFLSMLTKKLNNKNVPTDEEGVYEMTASLVPVSMPSVRCGLEMALLDLISSKSKLIFLNSLSQIKVPINGLVWMGDEDFMKTQIKAKLDAGFQCIKLKVGALDFDAEIEIIKSLRKISDELIIRLDANGAFQTHEVFEKLKRLAPFNIHSIEQPIMPRQPEEMAVICNRSEIPIALDEELIGMDLLENKIDLLKTLKPHYLVLKPTLHGGFSAVKEWITLADTHGIGWWVTSYLESNIGLNAIAQLASLYPENKLHHGLGTGDLYENNIPSAIVIDQGYLRYEKDGSWGELSAESDSIS